MELFSKKRKKDAPPNSYAVLFLLATLGLFLGALMVRKLLHYPGRVPEGPIAFDWEGPAPHDDASDAEAADDCVPVLVRDETRPADVLASMVDKSLDVQAKVTATDRAFVIDATAAVSDLTLTFNPPVTVPGGTTTTIPLPPAVTATVHPSGRIVCEVGTDGMCSPTVETPSTALWHLSGPTAGIAVRAEHQRTGPAEVRVDFAVKGAIEGGAVTGAGPFLAPPGGFIDFANNKKTLAPAMGSARWRCDWVL